MLGLVLGALPAASAATAAVKEFLAAAQQRGVLATVEGGSALRRMQGGSSMQDMQEIHERLSAASKSGQKPGILACFEAFIPADFKFSSNSCLYAFKL